MRTVAASQCPGRSVLAAPVSAPGDTDWWKEMTCAEGVRTVEVLHDEWE